MTWTRIDGDWRDNPKVMALSFDTRGLWLTVLTWCRQHETDTILEPELAKLAVGVRPKDLARMIGELLKVHPRKQSSMWWKVDGGYQVHDFEAYGPPGKTAEPSVYSDERRAAAVEAGRRGAEKRWGKDKVTLQDADRVPHPTLDRVDDSHPIGTLDREPNGDPNSNARAHSRSDPDRTDPIPDTRAGGTVGADDPEPDPDTARPMALGFKPHPSAVSDLAAHYQVPEAEIMAEVPEFVSYWAVGDGRAARKSPGGWQNQFRRRCRDVFEGRAPKAKPGRGSGASSGEVEREPPTVEQILAEQAAREQRTARRVSP